MRFEVCFVRSWLTKLLLIVSIMASTRGSSLWSLEAFQNGDLDFSVIRNNGSVVVNALVKQPTEVDPVPERNINFYLFTRNQLKGIPLHINDSATLFSSEFDFNTETKLLIHGFANSKSSNFNKLLKDAYMAQHMFNVIIVDWRNLCRPPFYTSAVDNARIVGRHVAQLLEWLVKRGLSLSRLHMLGHSIGAHIAGIAAHEMRYLGRTARITGLDPAKPMLELEVAENRLDAEDAEFVDCVHTCGGYLGVSEPSCSADFYPNGGTSPQPGCTLDIFGKCSHQRAYKYYAETVNAPSALRAVRCLAVEDYSPVRCSSQLEVTMGEHMDTNTRGIFYLATAAAHPFGLKDPTVQSNTFTQFLWYFMKIKN